MRRKGQFILLFIFGLLLSACEFVDDMKVENENNPNLDQVYANPSDYPKLLSGAYNSWWNHCIGNSPNFALCAAAEITCTGYGSWGASPFFTVPREMIPNVDGDPVLFPQAAAWYGFYKAIPLVNQIIRNISIEEKQVMINGEDYTQACLAHAYFIQGLVYLNLAAIYDRAYWMTESDDAESYSYTFTSYEDLRELALERIDKAIEICEKNTFSDPVHLFPSFSFTNESLKRFACSSAARLLACNARNAKETQELDWNRIAAYAQRGIQEDFRVQVEEGWNGFVLERDAFSYQNVMEWDWVRVHQRIIQMMAPDQDNAVYPWPYGEDRLGEVEVADQRFRTYFSYQEEIPWVKAASSKGYHILSHYTFSRFSSAYNRGAGEINFFTETENDLLLAEAILRSQGNQEVVVQLINQSRQGKGALPAVQLSDSPELLMKAIYYERFVETLMTYPLLGYFDRRRTDVEGMGLREGTVRHLPVPYHELILHGEPIYSFGGRENEL